MSANSRSRRPSRIGSGGERSEASELATVARRAPARRRDWHHPSAPRGPTEAVKRPLSAGFGPSIALALAVEVVEGGRTVVVLDADPQALACKWRDRRQADAPVVTDVQPSRLRSRAAARVRPD